MGSLAFRARSEGNLTFLEIGGTIDTGVAPQFEDEMKKAAGAGTKFIGDLTGLEHITSAGIGVLIAVSNEIASRGGVLVLAGVSEKIRKVFAMLNLDKLVRIHGSLEEARGALQG